MDNNNIRHEIVSSNSDIEVRFYLSEDKGSYVAPHWHNSLELGQHRTKTIFWILHTSCLHIFRDIAQFVLARHQALRRPHCTI